jgi:2-polyprenyl-3-methyl-5-hydroxy-6-metoxy-1,4-benzoquinol methylase
MKCLIDKQDIQFFHKFPQKALFNKPLRSSVPNAVADMYLCYNPATGHISSELKTDFDTQNLLQTIYTEIYNSYAPAGLSGLQKKFTQFVSNWLIKKLPASSKILEIGCHDGFMLNELHKAGHSVVGVEPSPFAHYAKETYNLDVRNEFFQEGMFEAEEFDVVIMRHVVEHVPDPVAFVGAAVKTLKKGGIAYIEVPNSQWSLEYSFFPEFHVDHISYFTMNSLKQLLNRTGLNDNIHFEAFNAYMRFPFLMTLAIKNGEIEQNENDSTSDLFLNFSVQDSIATFLTNYKTYINSLSKLKDLGKVAVWGSGSIGTQFAIDGNWYENDILYVDPNKISQGMVLSVTGQLINPPEILQSVKPDIVLIASGWEKDSINQVQNYIGPNTKVLRFADLLNSDLKFS